MLSLYLFACTLLLIALVRAVKFWTRYNRNRRLLYKIPGPPEYAVIGHLPMLMENPDLLFARARTHAQLYYPIYRLSTLYVNIVNFLEPNDIELVLSSSKHLSKSKIYTFLTNWLGTGLLTSTGSKWQKRRKILTPAFHFSILQQFVNVFNEETGRLVEKLRNETGKEINVIPPITHFTLQSIVETAMGLGGIDELHQLEYKKAIYDIGGIFLRRLAKPWYRINAIYNMSKLAEEENAVVSILHDFSNNIINRRETETSQAKYAKQKRPAMLDLLLAAKKNGADIDQEGIREEVDTFMFEGHDTTSMAISFIMLVLANLPEVQSKILDEILSVVGPRNAPTYDDLQNLKYTERCIKEALRLFPSVPFISRFASEEFTTHTGYTIPEGTVLHIHIFDLHRDPRIYPDPLTFDPDRFLPDEANKRHPFAYIPFSAGPRNCIGQRFAFLELKAAICGVLRNFILEKVDDFKEVQFKPDLVLRSKQDIRVRIQPRELSL